MSPKKQPQDSGTVASEQWSVVEHPLREVVGTHHQWRLVTFKNGLGQLRPGFKCDWCYAARVLTPDEMRRMDRRGSRSNY